MKVIGICLYLFLGTFLLKAQQSYWQQQVDYKMDVDVDIDKYRYKGKQELVYTNNSPDTLYKVFYHLYFNAFQPDSEMDIRSQSIADPDQRVGSRIGALKSEDIGFIKVKKLKQDGKKLDYEVVGTVLEVDLYKPIMPHTNTTFNMEFLAQIPQQIRRTGKHNKEGVALSMTQWYPKMAEYDHEGWHADPYIGREFHGVWGNFDVYIKLPKAYTIAGSGVLKNASEIGHGYADLAQGGKLPEKLIWHFVAENVHDFSWAADKEYIHDQLHFGNNQKMHFFYKNDPSIKNNWKDLQPIALALMHYFEEHIGSYPYEQYSIIQGGDGGMEYAMCTLITGNRNFNSLVGVTAHEMAHAWFQHLLATNESKYEWMDEGFTTYISTLAEYEVKGKDRANALAKTYSTYRWLANSGLEKPQTTHADRYATNAAYGASAYAKGAVFLDQLKAIVGSQNFEKILKRYYQEWKFKHPTPNDFKRVAERVSGIQLDWYLTDWTQTTNTIDYELAEVKAIGKRHSNIKINRLGLMPMPLDLEVILEDKTIRRYYIPLQMMRGEKAISRDVTQLKDWAWAYPNYSFDVKIPKERIKEVRIVTQHLADTNLDNNVWKR